MSGGKKVLLVLGAAAVITASVLGVEHIQAWQDCQSALDFPAANHTEVMVRSYQTSQSKVLTETETRSLLDSLREQARFAGIGSQSAITAEDHAYSVRIAAGDYYHIFIVAEQDDQNCLYGDSFVIKLKELPGVVSLLDGYFH